MLCETLSDVTAHALDTIDKEGNKLSTRSKNAIKIVLYFSQQLCHRAEASSGTQTSTATHSNDVECDDNEEASAPAKGKGTRGKKGTSTAASKKKASSKSTTFAWTEWRKIYLPLLHQMLRIDPSVLWTMSIVPENLLAGFWGYSLQLLEMRPAGISGTGGAEVAARNLCIDIIVQSVARFGSASASGALTSLATALVNCTMRCEHMCAIAADICGKAHIHLAAEIMGDLGNMHMDKLPANGVKNVGTFIEVVAAKYPELMTTFMPILKPQVDSKTFQMRSSLLHAMGSVVAYIHKASVAAQTNTQMQNGENDTGLGDSHNSIVEDVTRNLSQLTRTRDSLLDLIVERTHDVNHFTRAAVLKVWISLVETQSVPVRRIGTVGEIAVDRIFDKTAVVRKNAVALLTSILENNPFAGNLDETLFKHRLTELQTLMKARVEFLRANAAIPHEEDEEDTTPTSLPVIEEVDEENEDADEAFIPKKGKQPNHKNGKKNQTKDSQDCEDNDCDEDQEAVENNIEDDDEFLESDDVKEDSEVQSIKASMEHCEGGLNLIKAISAAQKKVEEMLKSKTSSDVIEAIRFFTRAVNFSIKGSAKSLRSAFSLIWHADANIQSEILNAFQLVYLTDGAASGEAQALPPIEVAANLVELAKRCDVSEMASLERIIGKLFEDSHVQQSVVTCLWAQVRPAADLLSTAASSIGPVLRVLAIIAKCVPNLMTPAKVRLIVEAALTPEALQNADMSALAAASQCLQSCPPFIPSAKEVPASPDMQAAFLSAAVGLRDVLLGAFCGDDEEKTRAWFAVAEEAMHALFHIHPSPDKVVGSIIAPLYQALSINIHCSAARLSRVLFILGQAALCSLVYTERMASEAKKATDKAAKNAPTKDSEQKGEADAMEEEMGMAAAADADHERIFLGLTERLVFDNLLGKFHPLISFVVANEKGTFSAPIVREAAVLALCRYMSVSSIVCESYLGLLFTVLTREPSEKVRTTIVVALGDLAFRFPNALEPWTMHMYARLSDDDVNVRYNALMVLTHLILNDMVKVKGQVSQVVCCLTDKCEAIRDLATLFFNKLSERSNNPVYNLLGDIIASLSAQSDDETTSPQDISADKIASNCLVTAASLPTACNHRQLTEAEFEMTMQFLLSFVQKDKQADALVERLCIRIGAATSLRQRRFLAFCVGELSVSDKGVRKVVDLFKQIKAALYDGYTHQKFKNMLSKAKKLRSAPADKASSTATATASSTESSDAAPTIVPTSNASGKNALEELEALLDCVSSASRGEMGVDATVADENTMAMKSDDDAIDAVVAGVGKGGTKKAPPKKKAPAKKASSRRKKNVSDDEGMDADDVEEEEEEEVITKNTTTSRRRRVLGEVN